MTMGTMHGGAILYAGTKLIYMYTYTAYIHTYIHTLERTIRWGIEEQHFGGFESRPGVNEARAEGHALQDALVHIPYDQID